MHVAGAGQIVLLDNDLAGRSDGHELIGRRLPVSQREARIGKALGKDAGGSCVIAVVPRGGERAGVRDQRSTVGRQRAVQLRNPGVPGRDPGLAAQLAENLIAGRGAGQAAVVARALALQQRGRGRIQKHAIVFADRALLGDRIGPIRGKPGIRDVHEQLAVGAAGHTAAAGIVPEPALVRGHLRVVVRPVQSIGDEADRGRRLPHGQVVVQHHEIGIERTQGAGGSQHQLLAAHVMVGRKLLLLRRHVGKLVGKDGDGRGGVGETAGRGHRGLGYRVGPGSTLPAAWCCGRVVRARLRRLRRQLDSTVERSGVACLRRATAR